MTATAIAALRALLKEWEDGAGTSYECAGLPADRDEHPEELPSLDTDEAENYGAGLIYEECATALRKVLDTIPPPPRFPPTPDKVEQEFQVQVSYFGGSWSPVEGRSADLSTRLNGTSVRLRTVMRTVSTSPWVEVVPPAPLTGGGQ